jgi:hypothetical protein
VAAALFAVGAVMAALELSATATAVVYAVGAVCLN